MVVVARRHQLRVTDSVKRNSRKLFTIGSHLPPKSDIFCDIYSHTKRPKSFLVIAEMSFDASQIPRSLLTFLTGHMSNVQSLPVKCSAQVTLRMTWCIPYSAVASFKPTLCKMDVEFQIMTPTPHGWRVFGVVHRQQYTYLRKSESSITFVVSTIGVDEATCLQSTSFSVVGSISTHKTSSTRHSPATPEVIRGDWSSREQSPASGATCSLSEL